MPGTGQKPDLGFPDSRPPSSPSAGDLGKPPKDAKGGGGHVPGSSKKAS